MVGAFDPWFWLAASSSAAGLWVLLLFAFRRIPRLPPTDDLVALRYDFEALVDQFQDFVQSHDQTMASQYAKVGRLRGKLRKIQEEEGLDPEDVEDMAPAPEPDQGVLPWPSDRQGQKRAIKAQMKQRQGG